MKYLMTLLVFFSCFAFAGDMKPNETSPYVDRDRFKTTKMPNPIDYIITDTKSGCQYMVIYTGAGMASTPIGCFPEYKK